MPTTAIAVTGLTKRFRTVDALRGIDFDVPAGTIFGLLGPNGAGKTTAIRVLTTIARPSSGHVEVLGRDVVSQAAEVRHSIGLAGQYAAVDPNLTGRENLRLIGRLNHLARPLIRGRADGLLERFDLDAAADRPVRAYSGGMRRRLDVAAALVGEPPVLLLDEPTTGLDPASRNALWDQLRQLVREGTTVLLTTQYLDEADRLADRIAVLDRGLIIADDTPEALKASLGDTVVELDMGDADRAERAVRLLHGLADHAARQDDSVVRLRTHDGSDLLLRALRELDRGTAAPLRIRVREPSLDDVFLALTGSPADAPDDGAPPGADPPGDAGGEA
ncbi:ATP-binding cassette domain-containing protein [Streptomyces sp. ICBB 8177]|uniref:ATP-binding cassette domain-containing protein n=1 Tax=Streptomyces sp. ICBB 8177 TaxID=563922 RepID=UPI000D680527|nr:ATP-binding cassette domain-containing protein [Streptomyces sp. ICBB 8177]PWI44723.1 daunorubicin/doxorubicin resistance ABC transporter ATP-binding protein DrrA [Streptomyces sp. ICBB 8177]